MPLLHYIKQNSKRFIREFAACWILCSSPLGLKNHVKTHNRLPNWNDLADSSLAGELITVNRRAVLRAMLFCSISLLLPTECAGTTGKSGAATLPPQRAERSVPRGLPLLLPVKISGKSRSTTTCLEKILNAAEQATKLKAGTFCMVISGQPTESNFTKVLDAVREVKRNTI